MVEYGFKALVGKDSRKVVLVQHRVANYELHIEVVLDHAERIGQRGAVKHDLAIAPRHNAFDIGHVDCNALQTLVERGALAGAHLNDMIAAIVVGIKQVDTAVDKRSAHRTIRIVVSVDVEFRTHDFYLHGRSVHAETRASIASNLEIGLTHEFDIAVGNETRRILYI